MKLLAQHGHGDGDRIIEGMRRGLLDGAILSPRDATVARLGETLANIRGEKDDSVRLFDPQYYAVMVATDPLARLGRLESEYSAYFQARRRSQLLSESRVVADIDRVLGFQRDLDVTALIAPNVMIPASFDSTESAISMDFIRNTKARAEELGDSRPVYATLAVGRDALLDREQLERFVEDLMVMEGRPDGFYVLIGVNNAGARADTYHADVIAGWMFINHVLAIGGYEVINGYSDLISPLLGIVGGSAGATGWWSNLRAFSMNRFVPAVTGGRRPVPLYLSIPLLNRIRYTELDVLRSEFPVLNGLSTDAEYPEEGSEPTGMGEILQSWESIKALCDSTEATDLGEGLGRFRGTLEAASGLYDSIQVGPYPLERNSDPKHIEALAEALRVFCGLAEIEVPE